MRRLVEVPAEDREPRRPKPMTEVIDDADLDLVVTSAIGAILSGVACTPRQREILDEILTTYTTDRTKEGLWFALRRLGHGKLPARITIPTMQYIVNNPPISGTSADRARTTR